MNHPVPADQPSHPEWAGRRPSRPHPLHLDPGAVRSIQDLTVAAAQRQLAPAPARPVARRPQPPMGVVVHRAEPERFRPWPWLGPIARVVLTALACAGILAIGFVTTLAFVAWYSR